MLLRRRLRRFLGIGGNTKPQATQHRRSAHNLEKSNGEFISTLPPSELRNFAGIERNSLKKQRRLPRKRIAGRIMVGQAANEQIAQLEEDEFILRGAGGLKVKRSEHLVQDARQPD